MPDSPVEAMERLRAVKGCGSHAEWNVDAVAGTHVHCPDCALLLEQAIEGPVEEATIERCATTLWNMDAKDALWAWEAADIIRLLPRLYSGGPRWDRVFAALNAAIKAWAAVDSPALAREPSEAAYRAAVEAARPQLPGEILSNVESAVELALRAAYAIDCWAAPS